MANVVLNNFKEQILNGGVDLLTDTIKAMLCTSTYVPNADDTTVDDGSADDAASGEISTSGYVPGFAGAGRHTLASKSIAQDDANDRAEFTCANPAWTALATGVTIAYLVIIKEITNDAASLVLAAFDVTDTPTNGGDITFTVDAQGLLQLA